MTEADGQSFTDSIKQESLDTAKQLAPWRAGLPWWVVLVEGIVMGVIGILILIDPRRTTINIALFLAAALVVAGFIQLWAVMRGKAPESVDSLMAARGAVGVFAGATVLLLFFLDYLTLEDGLVVFGVGSLVYGLTGFGVALKASGPRRRSGLIEGVFFTLFGALLIYVLFAGPEQVHQATRIVGWTAIVGGLVLIGLAFYNRTRDADGDKIEVAAIPAPSERTDSSPAQRQAAGSVQADAEANEPALRPGADAPDDELGGRGDA